MLCGNIISVKRMKKVNTTDESLDEFARDVGMSNKFRREQTVHFSGACVIPARQNGDDVAPLDALIDSSMNSQSKCSS